MHANFRSDFQRVQKYRAILTRYVPVANSAGSHMHDTRVHRASQCLEHPPFVADRMKPHEYSSIKVEDPVTEPSIYGDDVHFGISLLDCHVGNKWQNFLDLSKCRVQRPGVTQIIKFCPSAVSSHVTSLKGYYVLRSRRRRQGRIVVSKEAKQTDGSESTKRPEPPTHLASLGLVGISLCHRFIHTPTHARSSNAPTRSDHSTSRADSESARPSSPRVDACGRSRRSRPPCAEYAPRRRRCTAQRPLLARFLRR